jgi:hypothetical protein
MCSLIMHVQPCRLQMRACVRSSCEIDTTFVMSPSGDRVCMHGCVFTHTKDTHVRMRLCMRTEAYRIVCALRSTCAKHPAHTHTHSQNLTHAAKKQGRIPVVCLHFTPVPCQQAIDQALRQLDLYGRQKRPYGAIGLWHLHQDTFFAVLQFDTHCASCYVNMCRDMPRALKISHSSSHVFIYVFRCNGADGAYQEED